MIHLSIEEMLASIGYALDPEADDIALHYRHLSVSILRQLRLGRKLEDIVLDRARGHVISKLDPVTGGVRYKSLQDWWFCQYYLIVSFRSMLTQTCPFSPS